MLSIGLHDHCNVMLITAVLPRSKLAVAESLLRDFLNSLPAGPRMRSGFSLEAALIACPNVLHDLFKSPTKS